MDNSTTSCSINIRIIKIITYIIKGTISVFNFTCNSNCCINDNDITIIDYKTDNIKSSTCDELLVSLHKDQMDYRVIELSVEDYLEGVDISREMDERGMTKITLKNIKDVVVK